MHKIQHNISIFIQGFFSGEDKQGFLEVKLANLQLRIFEPKLGFSSFSTMKLGHP